VPQRFTSIDRSTPAGQTRFLVKLNKKELQLFHHVMFRYLAIAPSNAYSGARSPEGGALPRTVAVRGAQ
jgi:hypothetical protein